MNFANYAAFRSAVMKLIDGDDASGSIHTDTVDLLIALGESRVYAGDSETPGLRTRDMEATASVTVAGNAAPLPADCLELIRVQFDRPLEYRKADEVHALLSDGASGEPRMYTQEGADLVFYPEGSGSVTLRYYQRPDDLKTALHGAFNRYPECFLFAALAEAAPFIGEDARLPMWKKLWADWMTSAARSERLAATNGSRLTVRPR